MKVLHFYKTYMPDSIGGIEQVINQIARGTARLGITNTVLTISSSKGHSKIEIDGHLVHRCKAIFEIASTPFSISVFREFRQLAKEADIIHYHFPYPFADILHLISGVDKPTLVSYHSDIIKQKSLLKLYRPLMNCFLNSVDHIVAASPNYLESSGVLSDLNREHKVSVIPYGLDKNNYPNPSKQKLSYWRGRFGPRFFLFVGVLRYYKGLHILVEAAKETDYPIVILGAGPIEKELKVQAEKLGVNNVHFIGYQSDDDKVALLTLCYAVVFPSHLRSEAFGISLLEGAMYGKPLISSEIGTGTTFININKETGVVVPPSDPVALRGALDYLWDNQEVAKAMGERAEQRYWDLFTADKMSESYAHLYQKLFDEKSAS